jgi:hypothetical protein
VHVHDADRQRLPWLELVNTVTGWGIDEAELLRAGERIQNLRAAFNWREGLRPGDFTAHPRMMGEGDGNLTAGPLKGVRVALPVLRDDYYRTCTGTRRQRPLSARPRRGARHRRAARRSPRRSQRSDGAVRQARPATRSRVHVLIRGRIGDGWYDVDRRSRCRPAPR